MTKILIVDDEAISRKAMEKNFGKYGDSESVDNGEDAIKSFQKALALGKPYDLVVLDYSLEDKTGVDVLKSIRALEQEKEIAKADRSKVVMATGNRERKTVKECIEAGCNDYILKPIKADMVAEKMRTMGVSETPDAKTDEDVTEESK